MESWDHMCIYRGGLSPASFLWQKTYAASSNTRGESKAHVVISPTVGMIPFHPQWTNITTTLSVTSATVNSKGVSDPSALLGTALLSMRGHCHLPTMVSLFNKWRNGDSGDQNTWLKSLASRVLLADENPGFPDNGRWIAAQFSSTGSSNLAPCALEQTGPNSLYVKYHYLPSLVTHAWNPSIRGQMQIKFSLWISTIDLYHMIVLLSTGNKPGILQVVGIGAFIYFRS